MVATARHRASARATLWSGRDPPFTDTPARTLPRDLTAQPGRHEKPTRGHGRRAQPVLPTANAVWLIEAPPKSTLPPSSEPRTPLVRDRPTRPSDPHWCYARRLKSITDWCCARRIKSITDPPRAGLATMGRNVLLTHAEDHTRDSQSIPNLNDSIGAAATPLSIDICTARKLPPHASRH